ncbi:hypothetical protein VE03_07189 [Pseudogymnoascus sp. 23342-1-I1]|nr:hypothetical protein VE03_07189 [Pseudogymnoascus sp. 23342-1-I1]
MASPYRSSGLNNFTSEEESNLEQYHDLFSFPETPISTPREVQGCQPGTGRPPLSRLTFYQDELLGNMNMSEIDDLTIMSQDNYWNNHNNNQPEPYLRADQHLRSNAFTSDALLHHNANSSRFLTETELVSDTNRQTLSNPSHLQASLYDLTFFDNQTHASINVVAQSTSAEPLSFISQQVDLESNNQLLVTDPYLNCTVTNYTTSAPLGDPINEMSQYNTSEGIIISSDSNQLQMENENWTNLENISIPTIEETHESSNKEDTHQHHDLSQVPQDFLGDATAEAITKSQSACLESRDTSTKQNINDKLGH